jgi:WD40 repeat protein
MAFNDDHTSWTSAIAAHPNGAIFATGSYVKTLRLWDASNGLPIGSPLKGHTNWVHCVAFSNDGKLLVSGSADHTLRLWDSATGEPIGEPLRGHTSAVRSVAFSPDSSKIVSGSDDNTLRLWDATTGEPIGEPLRGHTSGIHAVAFNPDGTQIVSGSWPDGFLQRWDVDTRQPMKEFLPHRDTIIGKMVNHLSFKPNAQLLWEAALNLSVPKEYLLKLS